MSTSTTKKAEPQAKAAHTQGPVKFIMAGRPSNFHKSVKRVAIIGDLGSPEEYRISVEASGQPAIALAESATDLIADAFNVAHETGLTPRQLAEALKQREEQLHAERATCDKLLEQKSELLDHLKALLGLVEEARNSNDGKESLESCSFEGTRAAISKAEGR